MHCNERLKKVFVGEYSFNGMIFRYWIIAFLPNLLIRTVAYNYNQRL